MKERNYAFDAGRIPKIYHITMSDYPSSKTVGGIQNFIINLHHELLKVNVMSEVIALGFFSKNGTTKLRQFKIPILGVHPYRLAFSLLTALTFSMKRSRTDFLVHAHDMLFGGFVGTLVKFMLRRRLLITSHGLQSVVEAFNYGKKHGDSVLAGLNRTFLLLMESFVLAHADLIMCTSSYEHRYFSRRGVDSKKLWLVRNGIDPSKFRSKRRLFSTKDIVMLYTGRISEDKGIGALLQTFALLAKDLPELRLMIRGLGHEESGIKTMMESLKIEARVDLLPPSERKDMVDSYNNADIVAVPSAIETGTTLTLLEAMACERLVIVNSVGSLPLIVGNAGLVVPFSNPEKTTSIIKRVISDKKSTLRLTKLARDRIVNNFNWQDCFSEILKIYRVFGQ